VEAYELDYAEVARLGRKFDCIWSMNSLLHLEKSELPHVLGQLDAVLNENGLFHFGVYGGEDRAGVVKADDYPVPRYFSFFSDENLKAAVSPYFDMERFEIVMLDEDLHFQSLILRKKRS
jgi:cyclopropane fatty-acyl-phospholipid synthase-like methyltransferase